MPAPASRSTDSRSPSSAAPTTRSIRPTMASRPRQPWPFGQRPTAAAPTLLEPVMALEVVTPDDSVGDVLGDLSARRGRSHWYPGPAWCTDRRLFRPLWRPCSGTLPTCARATQGRATYSMQFKHYAEVPSRNPRRDRSRTSGPSRRSHGAPGDDDDGQGKVRSQQAARQHRDHRPRRPRQDHADGGDHEGARRRQGLARVHRLRPDRQGAGREGARHHDRDGARRVRDRRSVTTRTSTAPATPTTSRT